MCFFGNRPRGCLRLVRYLRVEAMSLRVTIGSGGVGGAEVVDDVLSPMVVPA